MTIYRRYFKVTEKSFTDLVLEYQKQNLLAHEEYLKILKDIGAKPEYFHMKGKLTGILFDEKPDSTIYKKVGNNSFYPKKNNKQGKEIACLLEKVEIKNIQDLLSVFELSSQPGLFYESKCYYSTLIFIPDKKPVAYITVPWKDEDPQKLKEYKKKKKQESFFDSSLDWLLWKPKKTMKEIKGWEVTKHIEEWNDKITKGN